MKLSFPVLALSALLCAISLQPVRAQIAPTPTPTPTSANKNIVAPPTTDIDAVGTAKSDITELSPFEITSDTNRGYYASNTTSGTRLNSKVEDLGASITVVTKEQMRDFALLDINDIFAYEAGTEGTAQFTDASFNASGILIDNSQLNPQGANRIRGLSAANITSGNFETSGRTPLDPIDSDGVEISRGPNSSIFGIGSPAGTVNSVPAAANLSRNAVEVVGRIDSRDGYRTSLDFNEVLYKNKLAFRLSGVLQHDGFELKPSGVETRRYNAMVKYRPFRSTTITASYRYYHSNGNRPNATTPRDGISGWIAAGRPSWDPVTQQAKINGVVVGTYPTATTNPSYFTNYAAFSQTFIDQSGVGYMTTSAGIAAVTNQLATQGQAVRLVNAAADPTGFLASQPLLQDYPALSNKAIYDWSSVNIASQNSFDEKSRISTVLLEQDFLNTQRQSLALQLGWFQENGSQYRRNLMGTSSATQNFAPAVSIDVNERLLDGTVNPYFGRPFVGLSLPFTYSEPIERDTYRAQLAYKLDLRGEKNILRWLGLHQITGYGEYKDYKSRQLRLRDGIIDNHSWISANFLRGGDGAGAVRTYQRYYVGDANGYNVDYGPTPLTPGPAVLTYGNGVTGVFTKEPVVLGITPANNSGGANNSWTIIKSQGGIIQSHFLGDRLVTTFGLRSDQRYSRSGTTQLVPDGLNVDYASFNGWDKSTNWQVGKGKTTTAGAVLRPLNWFSFFVNRSSSFNPQNIGYGLQREVLPDPTGRGEDYGFNVNLLDGKLVLRVNRYKTTQINVRNGDTATIATRTYRLDYSASTGMAFVLQRQATDWINLQAANQGIVLSADQLLQRVADVMKVPVDTLKDEAPTPTAADDAVSRGTEVELNYNPTRYWRIKMNGSQQQAINSGVAEGVQQYLTDRLAVWQTVIDPRTNTPWFTTQYSGASASAYYASNIATPLQVARALKGKSRPQVREYRVNFLSSVSLAQFTDHNILKRFTVGGAVRWEDKAAIGYYGVQQLPAIITDLDVNRPIYDKARYYPDAFVSYRTKVFGGRAGLRIQANVSNFTEGGRLQAIAVEANGVAAAYRIIEPRLFKLTATFEF